MRKINVVVYFLLSSCFIACFGCERKPEDESFLDKEYTFIVGLITPDTLRDYRHEVFVGKIKPVVTDDHVPESEDPWNYLVTRTMHSYYRAKVAGTSGAVVSIINDQGDSVLFTEIKEGIYQDVNNALQIEPQKTYRLNVYVNDRWYTGTTTTPGNFRHFGPADGDTVDFQATKYKGSTSDTNTYIVNQQLPLTSSLGASFYRHRVIDIRNGLQHVSIDHFMDARDALIYLVFSLLQSSPYSFDYLVEERMEITAIDPNYAKMYRPGGSYVGTKDWSGWFDQQNPFPVNPILDHSTIGGDEDVAGVFGSYNRITLHYWAKGLRTSNKVIPQSTGRR
ncbi:hypothetical protein JNM05_00660 [bacterium]|nr:hypothetical protein [bacterium]